MPKTTTACALIVDDEADIRELVEITLARMGLETDAAADLGQAREKLATGRFDLCLTDMRLPDGNGIDLVHEVTANQPNCPIAVMTAYGNMETAVASLKAGAFDFVSKPIDIKILRTLVKQALKLREDSGSMDVRTYKQPKATPQSGAQPASLLGSTPVMQQLRQTIDKLARSQAPVYITGESGTGKELVARTIHGHGPRANMPFVPVNCGAIPAELVESELFGHVKGAFTGASHDKQGLFTRADGGTLFLDEIADLPLAMQVKLLRAIQERAVRPVGDQQEHPVDSRIICATHRNLAELVGNGQFREDLYYRVNVIAVRVPTLRERSDDIPELAQNILSKLNRQMDPTEPAQLAKDAMTALQHYHYAGNVRELENILHRALTLCEGQTISADDLHLNPERTDLTAQSGAPTVGLTDNLEDVERQQIINALEQARHNKTKAAQQLGISYRALRYRLKKLGIK